MGTTPEHIMLNDKNQYHAIDYAGDRKRFVVAGKLPIIEIYDEEAQPGEHGLPHARTPSQPGAAADQPRATGAAP